MLNLKSFPSPTSLSHTPSHHTSSVVQDRGEPTGTRPSGAAQWPQISSNFGSYDLCGFPKAPAAHYRAWWLCNISAADAGRAPVAAAGCHLVHIVQSWDEQPAPPPFVAVYSNAPSVELLLNGRSLGAQSMPWAGWVQWQPVFEAGNLTAVARDAAGRVVATHTRLTPAHTVALRLRVDAPSPDSGTGASLVLDGLDAALVRVELVDAQGQVVTSDSQTVVTFTVAAGPGRVLGSHNGDPTYHGLDTAASVRAYHGLARGVVQVSARALPTTAELTLQQHIDVHGGRRTRLVLANSTAALAPDLQAITVRASAPGLPDVETTIPCSANLQVDGVLAVAQAAFGAQIDLPW